MGGVVPKAGYPNSSKSRAVRFICSWNGTCSTITTDKELSSDPKPVSIAYRSDKTGLEVIAMLRHASELYGFTAQCEDGIIGTLGDLYFDEEEWQIRYAAIQIEEPIQTRTALVSVTALGKPDYKKGVIPISLPREKVYNSPETDVDLPVTREYEVALHRYYEWPVYWGQVSFLDTPRTKGMADPSIPFEGGVQPGEYEREAPDSYNYDEGDYEASQALASGEPDDDELKQLEFAEPAEDRTYSQYIHSTRRIRDYTLQTTDEQNVSCGDVLVDESDWTVRYLVVRPRLTVQDRHVLLPIQQIREVRAATAEILLGLSQEDLDDSPEYNKKRPQDYERNLYAFYDKRGLT